MKTVEVMWALENIVKTKAAGVDEISAELLTTLPDDAAKILLWIVNWYSKQHCVRDRNISV